VKGQFVGLIGGERTRTTPVEVALAFVDAINRKDTDCLAELMTADHKFIDGDGSEHVGKDPRKMGWSEHPALIPDLTLSISDTDSANDKVILLGWSSGTLIQDGEQKPENLASAVCMARSGHVPESSCVAALYKPMCIARDR